MANPFQSALNEIGDTFVSIIFIVLLIIVLAEIGIAFGMQEFTSQLIESLGFFAFFILALPPIGLLIGIIIFIVKSVQSQPTL